ncbi:ribonuclease H-like domain-containing protein [Tanacetum coccineum]|uniref:Ribonuclease H-like domain-containing protein n=1 Tax=Tanacetum coccineum TaxID=301880 RepID=A0ABQ5JB64_9ASTR
MEAVSTPMVDATKLPKVILNGDSPPPKRTVNGVEQTYSPTTTEEKLARKNKLKARGTLLMALANEHQLKFNTYKTAKSLMEAIEKRFGVEDSYPNLEEKPDLETLSMDDLYKNLKIYEAKVMGSSSTSQNTQNIAFVSSNSSGSTTQAHGSNSTNTDSLSYAVIYSFFANQSNSPQLDTKDLQQIDANDLEEMDLKWQMVMLTMRAKRFLNKTGRKVGANGSETIGFNKAKVKCYNCHKRGHFARECRASRENKNIEHVEEGPTNFALMAYTSSGSLSSLSSDTKVSTCSKACLKSYETLKEHYDNLTKDFNKSQINVGAYKTDLESVEARLDVYKKNEAIFEEDIKILKLDIKLRDNALTELRKKFEKARKERDYLKLTLEKFENSSKNLSKLLEIQVSNKFKTGVGFDCQVFDSQVNEKYKTCEGYHVVPPPYTGNFMPPKHDLVLADEEEYVFSESITSVPAVATSEVKTSESKPNYGNVTTVGPKAVVSNNKGNEAIAIKASACWVWRLKQKVLDHVSKYNGALMNFKRFDYVDAQGRSKSVMAWVPKRALLSYFFVHCNPHLELKDKGVIDSGCSRHMTGNRSYLTDYEEINGGLLTLEVVPKEGKLLGKVK